MITDKDIEKLEKVFVTKEDIRKLKEEFTDTFAAKQDVDNLQHDFNSSFRELVTLITGGFNRMDQTLDKIEELQKVQNNHGLRLDIIENKVFA